MRRSEDKRTFGRETNREVPDLLDLSFGDNAGTGARSAAALRPNREISQPSSISQTSFRRIGL